MNLTQIWPYLRWILLNYFPPFFPILIVDENLRISKKLCWRSENWGFPRTWLLQDSDSEEYENKLVNRSWDKRA